MWLIPSDADTMASKTNAAYDRIVIHTTYAASFDHKSPHVYKYEKDLWINNDVANEISNHYPIGFALIAKKLDIDYDDEELTRIFRKTLRFENENSLDEDLWYDHPFQLLEDSLRDIRSSITPLEEVHKSEFLRRSQRHQKPSKYISSPLWTNLDLKNSRRMLRAAI